jgi:glycosyltransferase involved in cell wall biosynthesis
LSFLAENESGYIAETLAQFEPLMEKYNLEIIVSDANSADGTDGIVSAFSDKFPGRVVLAQKLGKQNIAIGRNYGAQQATGDILFHTDADVKIPDPDRFFLTVLQTFENPRIVAATVPIWVYPEEARLDDKIYHVLMNAIIRLSFFVNIYLAKGSVSLSGAVYLKKLVATVSTLLPERTAICFTVCKERVKFHTCGD